MTKLAALTASTMMLCCPMFSVASQSTVPKLRATVVLTIGGADAGDDASFGRISGLAVDKAGRIFVADEQDNQVRMFTASGALASRIGRKGSGPLEFTKLATITIGPDQLLWTRDEGNARMLGIDVGSSPARAVKNVPMTQFTGGSHMAIVFEADGSLVDESIWFDKSSENFRPLRLRRTPAGNVTRTDTLAVPAGAFAGRHKVTIPQKNAKGEVVGIAQGYYDQPFGPTWLRVYGPGGIRAEVVTAKYEVNVIDANGRVLRTLQRDVAPIRLSAREKREADSTINKAKVDLPFGVPPAKPPIVGLKWSQDGELWVARSVADGAPREADIYDRNGRLIASASWDQQFDLTDWRTVITGRTATLVATDDDDLQRVVRLQFR